MPSLPLDSAQHQQNAAYALTWFSETMIPEHAEPSPATVDYVDFTDHALVSGFWSTVSKIGSRRWKLDDGERAMVSVAFRGLETVSSAAAEFQNFLKFHMQTFSTDVNVENAMEEWKERFHAALDDVAPTSDYRKVVYKSRTWQAAALSSNSSCK